MKILEFVHADKSSPYANWFNSLGPLEAAKVTVAKARLEGGNTSAVKWFKGIGEYVIDWGPGYRIYLAKDGEDLIILFGGGTKNGQQQNINAALALHTQYKAAKKAANKAVKVTSKGGAKSSKPLRK